ncbi:MAG: M3 family oligoendopeptidase [Chloroflexi bacterium]|nr:M3 family oligoendopeptidase [Chloroflexota bacterium]
MFPSLPQNPTSLMQWSWTDVEPYFKDLAERALTAKGVADWLADWTALDERLSEMYSRLNVATSQNVADKEAEARLHAFLDQIYPQAEAAEQKLREKLLASGLTPKNFDVPLKKMRAAADLFREANLPLLTQEQKYAIEYDKIIGAQTIQWEGQEVTVTQLRPVYQDTDRGRRERAWRAAMQRQLADRSAINELWGKFLELRKTLAVNADKPDYREYRWQELLRFDYAPADCARFHDAIERAVVPAAKRLYAKRRQRLGVETLRPWDLHVDPFGRPPLKPFADETQIKPIAASIFHRVDPQLGGYFDIMARESLLDLDNRKNKAPGGYCTSFPMSRRPFIFMNAVGLHDDLQTVLHESGHAFHNFERYALPYSHQRQVGMEFAEVASMSMELLAAPYLGAKHGGVYSDADAARARVEHLESNILFWPYMAVVDAFQHWVYENPNDAADPSKCDTQWAAQWQRFMGGVDWSGLEQEMQTGWHRKLHIHQLPFYYIEYGLAQLGAMQIWRNALRDQAGAVASYRRALALGGTLSLPELFAAAGAKLAFDADTLGAAVELAEKTIAELERGGG